ncbi:protein indeterminate-domain 5, chloroplastic-like [Phragmites australis]|uniref:protein indeterminate-domain 5, chloroplastic-like n=1 Tax=Phragmites australis TaxID=29695 RepID=UPI002D7730B6|nr:protein indeterminate-domain 5, chloroplastic-like [Phragmites australis]XP_062226453.1 protein indeterminate-domain 5, chloroplastic-like [Phragmites australis]XP_062226454.1 protein indeterminate-domain 5, chloroplastic-like [Phragmites australis]XP_062226455.1 protein indeterminate-domain 5, chloroplastic-like [Phragmites australis]
MASNSSAAAAAFFGIRDGDQQDQIKPLISPQQQLAAALPGVASGQGAPAAAPPPPKKKRTLPDPDAEVIALSPKTLMATNRFVCEVCNKGFQREQNLQLHRRGHNLPWKLKQKNPLQVQRRRVYLCPEPTCVHHDPSRALGDLTGIKKHFCRKHGEKKWKCEKCSKRYAVQSDWKAHSKICGTREYRCDCGTLFSRRDSFITHRAFCDALAQESARLPPTSLSSLTSQLYGASNAGNMALSLSQVGSHLTSTLQDGHHHHPSPELLRLGGVSGGGGIAARLDHLLSPSGSSAFRSPQAPPPSAFFLNAAAAAGQDFGDDVGNGSHSFLQAKPFHGLMQLPDLQGNGAGGPGTSMPNFFNLGFFANNGNSSGSSHEHASQGLMNNDQFSGGADGGVGGGGSEASAGGIFGGNFVGGGDHVPLAGLYNDQASMLPQMSATALLQKAAQMGATSSANGAASMFRGFVGSSPHVRPAAAHMEQSEANLNDLMNSLTGGGVSAAGMFGGSNGGGGAGMFDPRHLCDMEAHEVKFGQGGGDMTRDFLGVGGGIVRGMSTPRGSSDMSSLEAEMKSASSFNGGRMP